MAKIILSISLLFCCVTLYSQKFNVKEVELSSDYRQFKAELISKLGEVKPGVFGEFGPGMKTRISTDEKIAALTLDACGGPHGSKYDTSLIEFLKKEKISATLFITGTWIDKNDVLFRQLCKEPLFEIENHGLMHRPCTVTPRSKYGIAGTGNINAAIDEIEMNARKIEFYTHRKPRFFRPGTATADEGCIRIATQLNEQIVSYDVLSGDAVAGLSAEAIEKNIIKQVKPGSIIIMHMNQPKRNGFEALREAVHTLKEQGYEFVKLEEYSLGGKK